MHEVRHPAADRRDAHDLGRSGRLHRAWGLQPDIFVIGKSIGGGIPSGAYGITEEIAAPIRAHAEADLVDVGGVGGTLAGNVLSTAAMRATLGEVLTDAAFDHMIALATRFREGVEATLVEFDVPWSIAQLGARAEYRFVRRPRATARSRRRRTTTSSRSTCTCSCRTAACSSRRSTTWR